MYIAYIHGAFAQRSDDIAARVLVRRQRVRREQGADGQNRKGGLWSFQETLPGRGFVAVLRQGFGKLLEGVRAKGSICSDKGSYH